MRERRRKEDADSNKNTQKQHGKRSGNGAHTQVSGRAESTQRRSSSSRGEDGVILKWRWVPVAAAPWQGQSQERSESLNATMQPRWVQMAETAAVSPESLSR